VPIQIDLDAEGFKIRDAFVWNAHGQRALLHLVLFGTDPCAILQAEKLVSPEMFARTFCDDLDLDLSHVAEISKQIREQVQEATGVATIPLRSEEEEADSAEKDLRVVLSVSARLRVYRTGPSAPG
jgi:chromatin structure-remodeling complex subunit SFH1